MRCSKETTHTKTHKHRYTENTASRFNRTALAGFQRFNFNYGQYSHKWEFAHTGRREEKERREQRTERREQRKEIVDEKRGDVQRR